MHKGSCHCGKITYEVAGDFDKVIECNCSYCSRKGLLLWFVPRDKLTITQGETAMSTYKFNKHVIAHEFCPECGCAPFGLGTDPKGNEMAAINIRCLEGVDLTKVTRVPFDGLSK
jgi:hypothetical protein